MPDRQHPSGPWADTLAPDHLRDLSVPGATVLAMSGPDAALRRLTRDVGKLLQPYGFHGTDASWSQVLPDGVARIGRTRVQRTWIDGQQVVRFGLTLSATPVAWWEFTNRRSAAGEGDPIDLAGASGPDLLGDRELPPEATAPWTLRSDPDRPGGPALEADVDVVRAQLPRRVHAYARRALRLLEPGCYAQELQAIPDPSPEVCEALVVLLAADGAGPGFDRACRRLEARAAETGERSRAAEVIAFARGRAAPV